jgi:hypothetical protein
MQILTVRGTEGNAMEKSCWEEFAKTGKVTDYLKYRGVLEPDAPGKRLTKQMTCETAAEWPCEVTVKGGWPVR